MTSNPRLCREAMLPEDAKVAGIRQIDDRHPCVAREGEEAIPVDLDDVRFRDGAFGACILLVRSGGTRVGTRGVEIALARRVPVDVGDEVSGRRVVATCKKKERTREQSESDARRKSSQLGHGRGPRHASCQQTRARSQPIPSTLPARTAPAARDLARPAAHVGPVHLRFATRWPPEFDASRLPGRSPRSSSAPSPPVPLTRGVIARTDLRVPRRPLPCPRSTSTMAETPANSVSAGPHRPPCAYRRSGVFCRVRKSPSWN